MWMSVSFQLPAAKSSPIERTRGHEIVLALSLRGVSVGVPFCTAALPILDTIARRYERKSLRRQRFPSYMKRDRALDELCKRIREESFEDKRVGALYACHNAKGAPLYCERDVNAVHNILTCSLSRGTAGQRPEVFSRQTISPTNPCSSGQGLGFAVRISSPEDKPSKRTRRACMPLLQLV